MKQDTLNLPLEFAYNPELYSRLSEPFDSDDTAKEAAVGFLAEVRALREKYQLPNVSVVLSCNVMEQGQSVERMTYLHMGDPWVAEGLLNDAALYHRAENLASLGLVEMPVSEILKLPIAVSALILGGFVYSINEAKRLVDNGQVWINGVTATQDTKIPKETWALTVLRPDKSPFQRIGGLPGNDQTE